eukprot:1159758-Pelagomonas_calceolata.AAC.2
MGNSAQHSQKKIRSAGPDALFPSELHPVQSNKFAHEIHKLHPCPAPKIIAILHSYANIVRLLELIPNYGENVQNV